MLRTRLDHLIVLAKTLEEGCAYVMESLGQQPVPGGRHSRMGTHNALLGLHGGLYLEVLAPDPEAEPEAMSWFGLQSDAVKSRLAQGPYLAHWVIGLQRPQRLSVLQAQYPERIAPLQDLERNQYQWEIAVPTDGDFPSIESEGKKIGQGVLPTLLQWHTPQHPFEALPKTELSLHKLRGFHSQAHPLHEQLAFLGADKLIQLEPTLVEPSLVAEIEVSGQIRVLK